MAISDILSQEWNNERLGDIQDALQALLNQMVTDINGAKAKKVADINLSTEGTTLTATVTFGDETEASASVDIQDALNAADIAVDIVNNLRTDIPTKALSAAMGMELNRKACVLLEHMHLAADTMLTDSDLELNEQRLFFVPTLNRIYAFDCHAIGSGLVNREVTRDVYPPRFGVVYYDLETATAWRWDGTNMVLAVHPPYFMIADSTSGTIENYNPSVITGDVYPRLVWFSALSKLVYFYTDGQTRRYVAFDPDPNRVYVRLGSSPKVVQWSGSAWVDVIDISSKANAADVAETYATKSEVEDVTPTIDPTTKNWVVGGETTEYPSRGEKGDNAPVPYVGQNGNWWVDGEDTEVPAQGDKGDTVVVTDGQTFEFANNLHDDSTTKGLTAAMGKRLGDAVFNRPFVPFDTTAGTLENVYIDINNNTWAKTNDGLYKGRFFDVSAYAAAGCRFKIVPKEVQQQNGSNINKWYQTRFAFLTTNSHTVGDPLSFAGGATQSTYVTSKNGLEGVVPADATHLYIYCYNSSYINGTDNFPPDLSFLSLMPTNRIDRLEELTEGVDEIKEGWFEISGEDYDYDVPADDFWDQQNIDANTGATYIGSQDAANQKTFPKSASKNTAAASPSDCYKISDLPDRKLKLTFSQRTDFENGANRNWSTAIALYDASMSFLSRTDYKAAALVTDQSSPDYGKLMCVHDFSGSAYSNAVYFKIVLSRSVSVTSWTFKAGDMSFVKRPVSQDSMPDRVEALEEKVTELSGAGVSKFRICSWNVGHWCLGGNYKTDIDTQAKYEGMRGKWRTKLNEISPDVIVMCEYSTVFAELDTNVEAKDAIFGHYAYRAIGSVPSATSWMQTAQYTNIPIRNTSEVVYAQTVQAGRYYQVSDLVLGGVTAKLVITHLDWGNSQNNGDACRAAQMQTLLDAFANESHVIICGDFNNPLASEWDVFANAGYSMANHGYMGDLPTYPATKVNNGETVPPDKAIDNILVKGFAVNKIEIVDDATLTDHCGIMCDLTLID